VFLVGFGFKGLGYCEFVWVLSCSFESSLQDLEEWRALVVVGVFGFHSCSFECSLWVSS